MEHLIYYVASGDKHKSLAAMSADSLRRHGYAGDIEIEHVDGDIWNTKKRKATYPFSLERFEEYDSVMYLDADTLAVGDVTPIMDKIAANPTKLYLATASNKRLLGVNGLVRHLGKRKAIVPEAQPMLDSYAIGFVPNNRNLDLLRNWDMINQSSDGDQLESDAMTLNLAVVFYDRLPDVEILTECERLNGKAKPTTIIEHYVYGAAARMPMVYRWRFGETI